VQQWKDELGKDTELTLGVLLRRLKKDNYDAAFPGPKPYQPIIPGLEYDHVEHFLETAVAVNALGTIAAHEPH
jgi:hypothetical protein